MARIVGVHFRNAGKVYYFDPKDLDIKMGDKLIVETARGVEMGTATLPPQDVEDDKVVQPLKEVIRIATEEDLVKEVENRAKEDESYRKCKELIMKHELEMKLVEAEYTFDNNKLLFYFTAEGRVDFRELVKELAGIFRTRIELRQIGVRDETKVLGGIGICGRELCCKSYLTDFSPVSIKMAKTQNLSLNPTKISGVCGRLMCCLTNEEETYEFLNSNLPKIGDEVHTVDGSDGVVTQVNVLRQKVKVLFEEGDNRELREYPTEELTVTGHRKKGQNQQKQNKEEKKNDKKEEPKKEDKPVEKKAENQPKKEENNSSDNASNGGNGENKNKHRRNRHRNRNRKNKSEGTPSGNES